MKDSDDIVKNKFLNNFKPVIQIALWVVDNEKENHAFLWSMLAFIPKVMGKETAQECLLGLVRIYISG